MPRNVGSADMEKWQKHKGKKAVAMGILVFIIGLLRYLGYDWSMVLMIAGILMVLYGFVMKMK